MNSPFMWNDEELKTLFLNKTPLIDVRAPIEFQDGSLPHSVNLPIMNNEERAMVGTDFKHNGQASAVKLGHELVSGKVKEERVIAWKKFFNNNPQAQVLCFRGGLRSQISCEWMRESGIEKYPIHGGYKRLRQFFLSWLNDAPLSPLIRIGGLTGSGKTKLLIKLKQHIDIEDLANHRGSAFGPMGQQPSQVTFENALALKLLENFGKTIIVEDESIKLGNIAIPNNIFLSMRSSPLVILEVSEEERLKNIYYDYVQHSNLDFFLIGLEKIHKRLGGAKFVMLSKEMNHAFSSPMNFDSHVGWITLLFSLYYDPLYQKDLGHNHDKIIFKGKHDEVLEFLNSK